jgi:hypothetical protein
MVPMTLPSVDVTIDDNTYTINTLDAEEARAIWVPLFKAMGGALDAFKSEGSDESKGSAVLGRLIQGLPNELIDTMVRLYGKSSSVHVREQQKQVSSVYRLLFAGRPAHQIKWLIECTKVNFRDFLDGSSGLSLSALVAAASGPKSQSI